MEETRNQDMFNEDGIRIYLGYSHDLNSYRLFEYSYYNLDAFLKALIQLPINSEVFYHPSSIYGNSVFSGTKSFEEAWNLCMFGMDDGYQQFVEGLNYINFKHSQFERSRNIHQCVGCVPNVARFLMGNPDNMKRRQQEIINSAITIHMQVGYSAFTTKSAIINRGVCVLNLICYLEKRNFDCIFQLEDISVKHDEMIKIVVPIKRNHERLNIKLSYFPLTHPAFERRLIFRAMEIIPGIDESWKNGYGMPYKKSDQEIREMKNTIYISTPNEMGIYGEDLDEDFQNFVNYIDEKYHIYDQEGSEKTWKKTYGKRL